MKTPHRPGPDDPFHMIKSEGFLLLSVKTRNTTLRWNTFDEIIAHRGRFYRFRDDERPVVGPHLSDVLGDSLVVCPGQVSIVSRIHTLEELLPRLDLSLVPEDQLFEVNGVAFYVAEGRAIRV